VIHLIFLVLSYIIPVVSAQSILHDSRVQNKIMVGRSLSNIQLKNTENESREIPDFGKKVVIVFYTDPDCKDINDHDYRSKYTPALYLNSLDKKSTDKIISKCHQNKITVNEALITAFLYSIQKTDEKHIGKTDEVGVAINVRNELTPHPGESMGNFVSGILVKIKYDYSSSYWQNVRTIGIKLKKKLRNPKSRFGVLNLLAALDPELIDSIGFAKYGNYDNMVSKKLADIIGERTIDKGIGVTNLGKFDMKLINSRFEINDVVFIQPTYPANDINIGVLTLNNRMTFCLRFLKSDKSYELVDKIFCDAIRLLADN